MSERCPTCGQEYEENERALVELARSYPLVLLDLEGCSDSNCVKRIAEAEQRAEELQRRVWSIEDEVIGPYNEKLETALDRAEHARSHLEQALGEIAERSTSPEEYAAYERSSMGAYTPDEAIHIEESYEIGRLARSALDRSTEP